MAKVDEQLVRVGGQVAERAADETSGLTPVQRRLLEQLEGPGVERDIARQGDGQAGRSPAAGMIPILTLGSDITARSRSS